jgi:signal transduction histidine kinase
VRLGRDKWVAAGAIAVLAVLAGIIAALVLDAQQAGIETREDFRRREVERLANSLEARVQEAFTTLASLYGAPGAWRLEPNDPTDRARLTSPDPTSETGALLLDTSGTIVNGSLLRDPSVIGRTYEGAGLDLALAGEPTILDVREGLTTTEQVTAIATPILAADGSLVGVHLLESAVSPDSAFAAEVAQLDSEDGGAYTYVDRAGIATASSEPSRLGRDTELPDEALRPGFHRIEGKVYASADVPSARWSLVFDQARDDFEGDLTGPVRSALFVLLAAVVVAGSLSMVALLRRLQNAREEQRRLLDIASAREEFTSIVSHELRTPVAGLLGFLQTTVDHWDEMTDAERRQAVGRAQQNADRLQQLTLDVLDTTGMESGHLDLDREPLELGALVEDAAATARDVHPGREVTVERDADVAVAADGTRLRQVLANLVDNAAKSSPPGSPIELTVRSVDGSAEVAVRDHGTGIAADDRERVFEKFVRGRAGLTRGSGLGLYLSRQIVEAHGGTIWVADPDGPGALVVFRLPRANGRGR